MVDTSDDTLTLQKLHDLDDPESIHRAQKEFITRLQLTTLAKTLFSITDTPSTLAPSAFSDSFLADIAARSICAMIYPDAYFSKFIVQTSWRDLIDNNKDFTSGISALYKQFFIYNSGLYEYMDASNAGQNWGKQLADLVTTDDYLNSIKVKLSVEGPKLLWQLRNILFKVVALDEEIQPIIDKWKTVIPSYECTWSNPPLMVSNDLQGALTPAIESVLNFTTTFINDNQPEKGADGKTVYFYDITTVTRGQKISDFLNKCQDLRPDLVIEFPSPQVTVTKKEGSLKPFVPSPMDSDDLHKLHDLDDPDSIGRAQKEFILRMQLTSLAKMLFSSGETPSSLAPSAFSESFLTDIAARCICDKIYADTYFSQFIVKKSWRDLIDNNADFTSGISALYKEFFYYNSGLYNFMNNAPDWAKQLTDLVSTDDYLNVISLRASMGDAMLPWKLRNLLFKVEELGGQTQPIIDRWRIIISTYEYAWDNPPLMIADDLRDGLESAVDSALNFSTSDTQYNQEEDAGPGTTAYFYDVTTVTRGQKIVDFLNECKRQRPELITGNPTPQLIVTKTPGSQKPYTPKPNPRQPPNIF